MTECGSELAKKTVILANPRGFCAGVSRAIKIVETVLRKFNGQQVYVLHEVVHNQHVVQDLKDKGAIFVESLDEIPNDSIVIFSAHGVSIAIEEQAKSKNLKIFDATCPIVDKVHRKVKKLSSLNDEIIMIGHRGHQEVEGTLGQYTSKEGGMFIVTDPSDIENISVKNPNRLHFVTQTTLSVDETKICIEALKNRFPLIEAPQSNDICYATQNRQQAVKEIAKKSDLVLVVGSKNSSNSNRLSEVAKSVGGNSYLINDYHELTLEMIDGISTIAVTSGASAPEYLIKELVEYLASLGYADVIEIGEQNEKQNFKMPADLLD